MINIYHNGRLIRSIRIEELGYDASEWYELTEFEKETAILGYEGLPYNFEWEDLTD